MDPAKFALLLGTGLLALFFVASFYVVWIRMVGLDPTVAQWCATLSTPRRAALAGLSGVLLGTGSVAAPNVEAGISALALVGASTFAALMAFELQRQADLLG